MVYYQTANLAVGQQLGRSWENDLEGCNWGLTQTGPVKSAPIGPIGSPLLKSKLQPTEGVIAKAQPNAEAVAVPK